MMCHAVTGNLAEKTQVFSGMRPDCYNIVFLNCVDQLRPSPDPIPHRGLLSPFPILSLQQDKKQHELCCSVGAHMCSLPRIDPRASIRADSALSLSLSRNMNWGLCPTQSKVTSPILQKLNFYKRNSISLGALYSQSGVIQKLIGRDKQLRHMTGNMLT